MSDSALSALATPPASREPHAILRFNLDALAAVPWKNGGGTTREIACWPPQSDIETFDWRISVARIDRNGPFSIFAGVDRVITLLDGAGVMLVDAHDASHALTQRLQPHCFDGEAPIYGQLISDPSEDLNVMSRRSRIDAKVLVLQEAADLSAAPAGMLLAVGAPWHVHASDGTQHALSAGEGIWWHGESTAWSATPGATAPGTGLIAIALHDITAPSASGDTV